MASATFLPATMATLETSNNTLPGSGNRESSAVSESVDYWTRLIEANLRIASSITSVHDNTELSGSDEALENDKQHPTLVSEEIMNAPRRRSAQDSLACQIATRLYPAPADSLEPIIRYEKDLNMLRKVILDQRRSEVAAATDRNARVNWIKRIDKQGPWDEENDALSLDGAPSLPMPVEISDEDSLAPFFAHLRNGGTHEPITQTSTRCTVGQEPYYNIELLDFQKAAVYSDGRVDMCKMVAGPANIQALMESLRPSTSSKHFLLGNNIIGPVGAKAVADFIEEHPDRFETWYLAGNEINSTSLASMVKSMVKSSSITNVWLKRNPLGPTAAKSLFDLIVQTPHLRTLDLDQTQIGDAGVAELFNLLTDIAAHRTLPLRHIYLNANGISTSACAAISTYLSTPHCTLVSLYMSCNPIGSSITLLAPGLRTNKTLQRLSLQSCGLKDASTATFLSPLANHPTLRTLDLGQAYATEDLKMRYNWLSTACIQALTSVITSPTSQIQFLNLSYTPAPLASLNPLLTALSISPTILSFAAKPLCKPLGHSSTLKEGQEHARLSKLVRKRMRANVAERFEGMDYEAWEAGEKRFLVSPRDVRFIDSVYRNRDAGQARRGLKKLDKWWKDGDGTLRRVREEGGD